MRSLAPPLLALLASAAVAAPGPAHAAEPPLWTELRPAASPSRTAAAAVALPPVTRLAHTAGAAVVSIAVVQTERAPAVPTAPRRVSRSQGTGFLIHPGGYILTNHHVVEGADEIRVRLADEREFAGEVVGSDDKTDVALLRIEGAGDLPVAPLGDSDRLDIGEWVVAIGNPFGLDHTVTVGIISGKGRRDVRPGGGGGGGGNSVGPTPTQGTGFYDFIQTDASINVGNSGGPLLNLRGEVIGVNTAINAQGQGIAFAIPINMVKAILPMLKTEGRVARAFLGASLQPLTPSLARSFALGDTRGALVSQVAPGSPAERSGLVPGDVIVELDSRPIRRADDLAWQIATSGAGHRVELTVRRGGATRRLAATLGADPDDREPPPTIHERPRPTPLGITVSEIPSGRPESRLGNVIVLSVEPGSPASEAGLERGDVLLRVGDQPIGALDDYRHVVVRLPAGALIRVLANREGKHFFAAFAKR